METLLREKSRAGQNTKRGQQYSRLATKRKSHSHAWVESIRSFNVADAQLGGRTTIKLQSKNFVQDMALEIKLKDADGNYCVSPGARVVKSVKLSIAGRTFCEYNYDTVAFLAMHKCENEERRAKFESFYGPVAPSQTPGTVIVPIYSYWSTLLDDELRHQKPWTNPNSAAVLSIELQFASRAEFTASTDAAMENCKFIYTELMLPQNLENAFRGGDREVARIDWNDQKNIGITGGTKATHDISALHSGGPIRCIYLVQKVTGTGSALPRLTTTVRPDEVTMRYNGREVFSEKDNLLEYQQFLSGAHMHANCQPFFINFCEDPMTSDSSGFLPAGTNVLELDITPGGSGAQLLDIIVEYEKIFRKDGVTGRLSRSDN